MDRELRRLVLVGVGVLVLLFTGRTIIAALWDTAGSSRAVDISWAKLRSGPASSEPRSADMAAARLARSELEEELERLVPLLSYELPEAFSVGPDQSPDLRYIEVLRREQDALVKSARFVGRSVPTNLGMPDLNPTGLENVTRTLQTLHIAHRVVEAALEAKVDSVHEISVPPVKRSRIEAGFVRTVRVDFEVRGSARAVRDTLAGVLGGAPYLALDAVRLEAHDADGESLRCSFSALALAVDSGFSVLAEESR